MIRQAIACDICGAEKKETNHWFIAVEQGGEMRVSCWSSERKGRAGAKHLCGQTCLHRLVDDYIAATIYGRSAAHESVATGAGEQESTGLQGNFIDEFDSSARLISARPIRSAASHTLERIPRRGTGIVPPGKENAEEGTRSHLAVRYSELVLPAESQTGKRREENPEPKVVSAPQPRRFPSPSTAIPSPPEPRPAAQRQAEPRSSVAGMHPSGMHLSPGSAASAGASSARESVRAIALAFAEVTPERRRAEAWERERARETGVEMPRTRVGVRQGAY